MEFRQLESTDYAAWYKLFCAYREFHHIRESVDDINRVWGWLVDPLHPSHTILAVQDGAVLGFANFRIRARSIVGDHIVDLDDLYTDPSVRGRGVATALIAELESWSRDRGFTEVHWQTNDWNTQARRFYQNIGEEMPWVTIVKQINAEPLK